MVRLSKKERQDKLELLASINHVNVGAAQHEDNGKAFVFSSVRFGSISRTQCAINSRAKCVRSLFGFPHYTIGSRAKNFIDSSDNIHAHTQTRKTNCDCMKINTAVFRVCVCVSVYVGCISSRIRWNR